MKLAQKMKEIIKKKEKKNNCKFSSKNYKKKKFNESLQCRTFHECNKDFLSILLRENKKKLICGSNRVI